MFHNEDSYEVFKFWIDAVILKAQNIHSITLFFISYFLISELICDSFEWTAPQSQRLIQVLTKPRVRGKQMVMHSGQCFHIRHTGGCLRTHAHTIMPIGGRAYVSFTVCIAASVCLRALQPTKTRCYQDYRVSRPRQDKDFIYIYQRKIAQQKKITFF